MSQNIIKSHILALIGSLKAAGLFFSNKKCPVHAKGYTIKGVNRDNAQCDSIIHQIRYATVNMTPKK